MSIFDIRHQPRAHKIVQRALSGDRLPHAYLFHGPEGVGKELFAMRMASILLCGERQTAAPPALEELQDVGIDSWIDACNACEDCRGVRNENHPDLHVIYRQLNRYHPDTQVRSRKALDMSVDVIRHFVIDAVGATPVRGRAKVFIIREADRITPAAQNALLKTLEEPPDTTFLILLVSSLDRLLPTTLSRCHLLPFGPLPESFVSEQVQAKKPELPAGSAALFARLSDGSLGTAMQFADDGIGEYHSKISQFLGALKSSAVVDSVKAFVDDAKTLGKLHSERDPDISDTEAQRRGLKELLSLVSSWYREQLRDLASSGIAAEPHADAIERVARAERQLDQNANVQLCLEALLIDLSRMRQAC